MTRLGVMEILMLMAFKANAASFDCAKASSKMEKAIRSNARLSALRKVCKKFGFGPSGSGAGKRES
jgi:uncharacterized protein